MFKQQMNWSTVNYVNISHMVTLLLFTSTTSIVNKSLIYNGAVHPKQDSTNHTSK